VRTTGKEHHCRRGSHFSRDETRGAGRFQWRGRAPRRAKKKARRIDDAPSNKTYGNCLLGFHCSQKNLAANRAVARFLVVADDQQDKLSTCYPQMHVDGLGIVSRGPLRCPIRQKADTRRHDCSVRRQQSIPQVSTCAFTNLQKCQHARQPVKKRTAATPTLRKDPAGSPGLQSLPRPNDQEVHGVAASNEHRHRTSLVELGHQGIELFSA